MEQHQIDWIEGERPAYPDYPGFKAEGTSQEAARKIAVTAGTVRQKVLSFFVACYPRAVTADEVASELGLTVLTTRPRVSELHAAGLIEQVPERRPNESGMTAACWRATRDAIVRAANA